MTFEGHYQSIIVNDTVNAVAVDYDYYNNTIYWTDITSTNSWIRRLDLKNKMSKVRIRVQENVRYGSEVRAKYGSHVIAKYWSEVKSKLG